MFKVEGDGKGIWEKGWKEIKVRKDKGKEERGTCKG
jgi:hypothetical protein